MNIPPIVKQWRVQWPGDNDTTPVLAVWSEGPASCLICKVSPIADVTKDDLENATLIASAPAMQRALERLVFLYTCEQEGIGSGQPSPSDWFTAVDEASAALESSKTLPV